MPHFIESFFISFSVSFFIFYNFFILHFTFDESIRSHVTFYKHNLVLYSREKGNTMFYAHKAIIYKELTSIIHFLYQKIVTFTHFIIIPRHFLHFLKMPASDSTPSKWQRRTSLFCSAVDELQNTVCFLVSVFFDRYRYIHMPRPYTYIRKRLLKEVGILSF